MKMRGIIRRVLIGAFLLLLFAQAIRPDRSVPATDEGLDYITLTQPPAAVADLLHNACYDCHSYQSEYPWYSQVAPVSWWIQNHIDEGREHLNFSIWGEYNAKKQAHKLEECWEEVGEKKMPLNSFTWAHPEARLTSGQRQELVAWFKGSAGTTEGASGAGAEESEGRDDDD